MFWGFHRLHYANTLTDLIVCFYEQFWGVPLPEEHISLKDSVPNSNNEENDKENGGENDIDLLPTTPPPIIDLAWMQLLIHAEYLRIYKWVEDMYEVGNIYCPSEIVITGHPGIGQYSIINMRTLFLFMLLCVGKWFWAYYVPHQHLGEKSVSLVSRNRALSLVF